MYTWCQQSRGWTGTHLRRDRRGDGWSGGCYMPCRSVRTRRGGRCCRDCVTADQRSRCPSGISEQSNRPAHLRARRPLNAGPDLRSVEPRAGSVPGCVRGSPMGQSCLLQTWFSITSPTQSLPPNWGAGLLQSRLRFCAPPPQVTEQMSHGDQGPQPPLTRRKQTTRRS